MYKTVRHGENSLQYTILPQTEEVLSNSGLKGKGRDYSPSIHVRRSRRKSTVKYVLLVVFGVIVALALAAVPLYVMNGALYARRTQQDHQELVTTGAFAPAGREIVKSRKKELKVLPEIVSTLILPKLEPSTLSTASTTTSTVSSAGTSERATSPAWTVPSPPATKSWKSSTSATIIRPIPTEETEAMPISGTSSSSNRLPNSYVTIKPWDRDNIIKPTIFTDPIIMRKIKYYSQSYNPSPIPTVASIKTFNDALIITKGPTTMIPVTTELTTTSGNSKLKDLQDTLLSVDDDEEFKSLEFDDVFSLPSSKPEPVAAASDVDEVTVSKAGDGGWYGARWPFVDTSSYFQWTGYSPGDNLLLPLLMAALSSIVLVLLLALAVRRRKRSHAASAQIGKLTADLQADDNTNLLTAENVDEAEE